MPRFLGDRSLFGIYAALECRAQNSSIPKTELETSGKGRISMASAAIRRRLGLGNGEAFLDEAKQGPKIMGRMNGAGRQLFILPSREDDGRNRKRLKRGTYMLNQTKAHADHVRRTHIDHHAVGVTIHECHPEREKVGTRENLNGR